MKQIFTIRMITVQIRAYDIVYVVGDSGVQAIPAKPDIDDVNVTVVDFFALWCEGYHHELLQEKLAC